ncbi:MAG: response regulator transcription factor [Dehalococcoidia bacterium]|nr:response regulator transcription factor [Dehalococcoidia bacterium]
MLRVFIADDSALIRDRLKGMLAEQGGIEIVGWAENAVQAIPAIRRLDPDVVILDIRMTAGDGMPVLKDIKSSQPDRVVIVLTAFPSPHHREAYLAAGADYFLDKTRDILKMTELLSELAQRGRVAADGQH